MNSQKATEGAYGWLATNAHCYRPLDIVIVRIIGRDSGEDRCTIRVCDPEQRTYFENEVLLIDNRGTIQFCTGGILGAHYIYLIWHGETQHSRYINFYLDCETCIESSDPDFDNLYPFTREAMLLGRREYMMPTGKFVGYISADTWHFDGIWLRDMVYGLVAYRYWETDLICGLERFLEQQSDSGMIPDGIERDGRTWRVGLESDVEYLLAIAIWQIWQATGDDHWLTLALHRLEHAIAYIQSDPKHWDATHCLVKRQHSCDTWDFDIDGVADMGDRRHVVAVCDQSGYFLAFQVMSKMYQYLGKTDAARHWAAAAMSYRQRANELLWDGIKFQHHIHLDSIDHGDFNEYGQLAMGNTWAMTRGLANEKQSRSIIDQYRHRHLETGDKYPWWSLQPGYPDSLGYFQQPFCKQGGYANGGLMPWVGGELCRASFLYGREKYGVELLRAYAEHLRRFDGAQVWYWPDGTPGCRTTNEVRYAGWGMAEWVNALFEGLAGIHDELGQMRHVMVAPRWCAVGSKNVFVAVRYASSKAYIAYRMEIDLELHEIVLLCTGSGDCISLKLLLPEGWQAQSADADGVPLTFETFLEDTSEYIQVKASFVRCRSFIQFKFLFK